MKTLIRNARIVLRDSVLENASLLFENDTIVSIGGNADADVITDADGKWLVAGFIDIHCHGGGGYDFMDASVDEMRKIAYHHLRHGTTTLLATTMTDVMPDILSALDRYSELDASGDTVTLHGVHMEGPWFSPAECGAQDPGMMIKPDPRTLSELLDKYSFIERVSAAPELDGALEFGRYGKERGIIMSLGHTDADFDDVLTAAENGYTLATHLYSGMHCVFRKNAYRTAGAVEGCLFSDDINVEIIADGKHLPAALLKYIYKIKGADKICLITDANRGSGGNEGDHVVVGSLAHGTHAVINDGVAKTLDCTCFAGSVSSTDKLFRNMITLAGVSITDASKMASATPARVMGYTDRGEIAPGKRADLLLLDDDYQIQSVILGGKSVSI